MIAWNPLVNTRISLDGDYSLKDGYLKTLQFNSGKEARWLTNSFVPRLFPSLKLTLENRTPIINGKTEYEEFNEWFNKTLRYGVLPFQLVRFGYKPSINVKTPEIGVYKFISNSINYDRLDGIVIVSFGLEETGVIPEAQYIFLAVDADQILFVDHQTAMVI